MQCGECTWNEIRAEIAADEEAAARGEQLPARVPGRRINPENWYLADIEEDNAYVRKCRHGHEMKMKLQNVRYELLFESGIVAMLVGFHREAVSSIVAVLSDNWISPPTTITSPHLEAWSPVGDVLSTRWRGRRRATSERRASEETDGRDEQTRTHRPSRDEGGHGSEDGAQVRRRRQAAVGAGDEPRLAHAA